MRLSKKFFTIFAIALFMWNASAVAQIPIGTWVLEKSANFRGQPTKPPTFQRFETFSNLAKFSPECSASANLSDYRYDLAFQLYLKGGIEEAAVSRFFSKNFGINILSSKKYIDLEDQHFCSALGSTMFVAGNHLVVSDGGYNYYEFLLEDKENRKYSTATDYLVGVKITQLPIDLLRVEQQCMPTTSLRENGWGEKCAPYAYLNGADRQNRGRLNKIVGSYDYLKQSHGTGRLSNPAAHNLHPIFLAFPPKGDVILVHVYELELTPDDPDFLPTTYISVKNGVVVDQMDASCNFNAQYDCVSDDKRVTARLGDSGKFLLNDK